jgi:hypothetical protein
MVRVHTGGPGPSNGEASHIHPDWQDSELSCRGRDELACVATDVQNPVPAQSRQIGKLPNPPKEGGATTIDGRQIGPPMLQVGVFVIAFGIVKGTLDCFFWTWY